MFEREFYQNKEFHTNNGLVSRTAKSARLIAIFSMQDSTYLNSIFCYIKKDSIISDS